MHKRPWLVALVIPAALSVALMAGIGTTAPLTHAPASTPTHARLLSATSGVTGNTGITVTGVTGATGITGNSDCIPLVDGSCYSGS